MVFSPPMPVN